jgi:radical SAM modification target selenobiotic family peptide
METKDLKKFLAGFGLASLLAGAGLATSPTKAVGASG